MYFVHAKGAHPQPIQTNPHSYYIEYLVRWYQRIQFVPARKLRQQRMRLGEFYFTDFCSTTIILSPHQTSQPQLSNNHKTEFTMPKYNNQSFQSGQDNPSSSNKRQDQRPSSRYVGQDFRCHSPRGSRKLAPSLPKVRVNQCLYECSKHERIIVILTRDIIKIS